MTSNIQSLTQSHKVIRAKKKQKREQVPAVVFDEDARRCALHIHFICRLCITPQHREFLTGFHKRKVAKKEESKKKAIAREKQERLEARREVCAVSLSQLLHFVGLTFTSAATSYPRGAGSRERGKG
jgi:ribosomal RNA-processing protein 17